jgi:hypothetical protein
MLLSNKEEYLLSEKKKSFARKYGTAWKEQVLLLSKISEKAWQHLQEEEVQIGLNHRN